MPDNREPEWTKLNEIWYQKKFDSKSGGVNITYHYGSKAKKSNQAIELKIPITERYCGLKLIEKDLRDIKLYLSEYEKYLNIGIEKSIANATAFESIIAKGLLTTIVVHYIRCFPGSKGRKALIQDREISSDNINTHQFLVSLRNTYLAHSDVSQYERCSYVILVPPQNKAINRASRMFSSTELFQAVGIEGLVGDIKDLIQELYEKVENKLNDCENNINQIVGKLSPEKVYAFLKGKGKRIKVSESQVKKLILDGS